MKEHDAAARGIAEWLGGWLDREARAQDGAPPSLGECLGPAIRCLDLALEETGPGASNERVLAAAQENARRELWWLFPEEEEGDDAEPEAEGGGPPGGPMHAVPLRELDRPGDGAPTTYCRLTAVGIRVDLGDDADTNILTVDDACPVCLEGTREDMRGEGAGIPGAHV